MRNFKKYSTEELFNDYAGIINELRGRKIIRTSNNPSADYAEKLVADTLGLDLMPPSNLGFDAINKKSNVRYQIKARRVTIFNKSRQLGVIRNLDKKEFDYLIAVIFDEFFHIKECYQIPFELIKKYSRYSEHQHGHILILRGEILKDKKIQNITNKF